MRRPALVAAVLLLLSVQGGQAAPARPRLVVVISIDQLRADYLRRFEDLYLPAATAGGPGGFRYLMERGAYYTDAHHDHFPLYTGPGHAVQLTGSPSYKSGVVSNNWFDRDLKGGRRRYCVGDPESPLVGVPDPQPDTGISPRTLRVTTVGDELEMATGRQAKVWGLAFKDRAAVLMAGHTVDGVLWFDEGTGAWVSSRYYRPDGTLPRWVNDWNAAKKIDAYFGRRWTLSVPADALKRLWAPENRHVNPPPGMGATFGAEGHPVTGGVAAPGPAFYDAFTYTPFGNEYVLDTARELIRREGLGQDEVPDLLALNFSTNDYIGHAFGPDSAEVLDVSVQTDRQLSAFFQYLDKTVPGGLKNVTLVLTADHGVAPIAAEMKAASGMGGTYSNRTLQTEAEAALVAELGAGPWTRDLVDINYYLDLDALRAKGVPAARAEEIVAAALRRQPGIYAAYTRTQILEGRLPDHDIARRVARSFHPKVSGDVMIVTDPFWMSGGATGTTHGSPYTYDTAVPVIFAGFGVRPGRYTERASTLDIAPTLSDILGVLPPSGSEGRVLLARKAP
ncbi:MAG TPA: alkaline phosphatase family protein [Thermoanaerobaculia bacterium]|nr:alkaline phosphatase family protein [Thermoanaerobaculia bacterium]